jgi:hypothetical protein
MVISKFQPTASIVLTAAFLSCFAASQPLAAASSAATPTTVTYTATGTFASTPISGSDTFKLAGQTFTITVTATESQKPAKSGKTWDAYNKLKMTGTVQSGLVPTPFPISTSDASMELATGNSKYDVFALFCPIKVLGMQINILAKITLPTGTFANAAIAPFKSVTLTPASATVTYSEATSSSSSTSSSGTGSTNSTTLGLSGTLAATAN